MRLSVLHWNIWYENQLNGQKRLETFLDEFCRIIRQTNPDCICLNEALQESSTEQIITDETLKKLGYTFSLFAPASPLTDTYTIGTALYSKLTPKQTKLTILGPDKPAEKRGYSGHTLKGIVANYGNFSLIVAHPMHLRPYTLKDHYTHTSEIIKLLQQPELKGKTIVAGDFNEPDWLPNSFASQTKGSMNCSSGGKWYKTWYHNAWRWSLLRINLDKIFWPDSKNFNLKKFQILDSNISDHKPLHAEFEIE